VGFSRFDSRGGVKSKITTSFLFVSHTRKNKQGGRLPAEAISNAGKLNSLEFGISF